MALQALSILSLLAGLATSNPGPAPGPAGPLIVENYRPYLNLDRDVVPPGMIPSSVECPIVRNHEAKVEDCIALISQLQDSPLTSRENWEDLDEDCDNVDYGYCVQDVNSVGGLEDYIHMTIPANDVYPDADGYLDIYMQPFRKVEEATGTDSAAKQTTVRRPVQVPSATPSATPTVTVTMQDDASIIEEVPEVFDGTTSVETLHVVPQGTITTTMTLDDGTPEVLIIVTVTPEAVTVTELVPMRVQRREQPEELPAAINTGLPVPADKLMLDNAAIRRKLEANGDIPHKDRHSGISGRLRKQVDRFLGISPFTDSHAKLVEETVFADDDGENRETSRDTKLIHKTELLEKINTFFPDGRFAPGQDKSELQKRGLFDFFDNLNPFAGDEEEPATVTLGEPRNPTEPYTITETGVIATSIYRDIFLRPIFTSTFTSIVPPGPTAFTKNWLGAVVPIPTEPPKPYIIVSEERYTTRVRGQIGGNLEETRVRTRYNTYTQPTITPSRTTVVVSKIYRVSTQRNLLGIPIPVTATITQPATMGGVTYTPSFSLQTVTITRPNLLFPGSYTVTKTRTIELPPPGQYLTIYTTTKTRPARFGGGFRTKTFTITSTATSRDVEMQPVTNVNNYWKNIYLTPVDPRKKATSTTPTSTPTPTGYLFTNAPPSALFPGRNTPPPNPDILILATYGTCSLAINRDSSIPQTGGDIANVARAAGQVMKVCARDRRDHGLATNMVIGRVGMGRGVLGEGGRRVCLGERRNLMLGGC